MPPCAPIRPGNPANFSSRAALMASAVAGPALLLLAPAALADEMLVMPSSMPYVLEGDKFEISESEMKMIS